MTTRYIGEVLAAGLPDDQRRLLIDILNHSGRGPAATLDGANIQFFAVKHTLACIEQARPNLTAPGVALADQLTALLSNR